jgi:protocatechuate 3,4-dioxygenase, alpha subunit
VTTLLPTPGQTVGPFFRFGLELEGGTELAAPSSHTIGLSGAVFDGAGKPVPDALVEIWHPDAGFGRALVDDEGRFTFTLIEPDTDFIAVAVFARGLMDVLHTRIYLPDREDAFLQSLTEPDRSTLTAARTPHGLEFDIHLQGPRETVFVEYR